MHVPDDDAIQKRALHILQAARMNASDGGTAALSNAIDYVLGIWPPMRAMDVRLIRQHVHRSDEWRIALARRYSL